MTGETITRARLSEAVYQEVGLSRNESAELVESVIAEISGALERGEMVKISSFGSFAVRQKGQRVGRKSQNRPGSTDQPAPRSRLPRLVRPQRSDQPWSGRSRRQPSGGRGQLENIGTRCAASAGTL